MKLPAMAFVALIFASGAAHANTASETAGDYFNTLRAENYSAAATYFAPAALHEFRQLMSFADAIPAEKRQAFFHAFFGPEASKESVAALSDAEFFAAFLRSVMDRRQFSGGVDFEVQKIIGEVKEGPDVVHVVTRNRISVAGIEVESVEVVSFRNIGGQWKALLSGRFRGIAATLRTEFSRQQ